MTHTTFEPDGLLVHSSIYGLHGIHAGIPFFWLSRSTTLPHSISLCIITLIKLPSTSYYYAFSIPWYASLCLYILSTGYINFKYRFSVSFWIYLKRLLDFRENHPRPLSSPLLTQSSTLLSNRYFAHIWLIHCLSNFCFL